MFTQDVLLFLSDKIIKSVRHSIDFNLDNQLTAIKIELDLDNQKILFDKIEFTNEELKLYNSIQKIPAYSLRVFMLDKGYIESAKSPNTYKLSDLGKEVKKIGGIQEYQDSDLLDNAINQIVTTTPKINESNAIKTSWYKTTVFIYVIYPLVVIILTWLIISLIKGRLQLPT